SPEIQADELMHVTSGLVNPHTDSGRGLHWFREAKWEPVNKPTTLNGHSDDTIHVCRHGHVVVSG
ncbi:hypothetical protein P7K49_015356, partial [Saguinus oedipus]